MTRSEAGGGAGRQTFIDCARACGSDPITEEQAILSIDCAFLPPCALAVLDGGEATAEYWAFLIEQVEQAQADHDAEVAAGHEWHGEEP